MDFELKSEAELNALSYDELVAENQRVGELVDALRNYRRDVKQRYSELQLAEEIRAKHGNELTDEQVAGISAIIHAPKLSLKAGVKNNG